MPRRSNEADPEAAAETVAFPRCGADRIQASAVLDGRR